jgi:hypothetical protein
MRIELKSAYLQLWALCSLSIIVLHQGKHSQTRADQSISSYNQNMNQFSLRNNGLLEQSERKLSENN